MGIVVLAVEVDLEMHPLGAALFHFRVTLHEALPAEVALPAWVASAWVHVGDAAPPQE